MSEFRVVFNAIRDAETPHLANRRVTFSQTAQPSVSLQEMKKSLAELVFLVESANTREQLNQENVKKLPGRVVLAKLVLTDQDFFSDVITYHLPIINLFYSKYVNKRTDKDEYLIVCEWAEVRIIFVLRKIVIKLVFK